MRIALVTCARIPELTEDDHRVRDALRQRGASVEAYARVDAVERNGGLTLMELELIEPVLFLGEDAGAPGRFADAILLG